MNSACLEVAVDLSMLRPFKLNIDIVDGCNIKCVTCPRGNGTIPTTSARMKLERFDGLLSKLVREVDLSVVELFNWTEPFLHPRLDGFVSLLKKWKIAPVISTNLSFRKQALLEDVIQQCPSLRVSVSGYEQKTQWFTIKEVLLIILKTILSLLQTTSD